MKSIWSKSYAVLDKPFLPTSDRNAQAASSFFQRSDKSKSATLSSSGISSQRDTLKRTCADMDGHNENTSSQRASQPIRLESLEKQVKKYRPDVTPQSDVASQSKNQLLDDVLSEYSSTSRKVSFSFFHFRLSCSIKICKNVKTMLNYVENTAFRLSSELRFDYFPNRIR